MVAVKATTEETGGALGLYNLGGRARNILSTPNYEGIFDVHISKEEALVALRDHRSSTSG